MRQNKSSFKRIERKDSRILNFPERKEKEEENFFLDIQEGEHRYISLDGGGWTDRSMVQSRLSGHGGRVLAASRRLRLASPDSVRRRPDAGTVGRTGRSGHQSASSEPANLSLSLSHVEARARAPPRPLARTRTHTQRHAL